MNFSNLHNLGSLSSGFSLERHIEQLEPAPDSDAGVRRTMIEQILTIGVYGKSAEQFFGQLSDAKVDLFCDVRLRRGMRGSQYAFANSKRLQAELARRGIAYKHFPELAPSLEIRAAQHAADAASGVQKRSRETLSEEFKHKYTAEVLSSFNSHTFRAALGPDARRVVLFCVEGNPKACHRSLLADQLRMDWQMPVQEL